MSNKTINIHEIKAKFSHYAAEVMKGATFIVSMRNKPFAEFRPLSEQRVGPLRFGILKNAFHVPKNFNAPLSDFESDFYGRK